MDQAMERLMREICDVSEGPLRVSEQHVRDAVKSRKHEAVIGRENRAGKIRGWIADQVSKGGVVLIPVVWMDPRERDLAGMRLRIYQTGDQQEARALTATMNCEEAKAALMDWAEEHEEPARNGAPVVLRKEKRSQMRTARHRLWTRLGTESMDAATLLLTDAGLVVPEADPYPGWVREMVKWCREKEWTKESTESITERVNERLTQMREQANTRDGRRDWNLILDLGEGWGSIGTAAAGVEMATIGVDNAGALYQGTLHGHIRARVNMDFSTPAQTNLLSRIAKKAGVSLDKVLMAWLSPECTLLSRANSMNKSRGWAHGPFTESPQNLEAATPERLAQEREKYSKCLEAVEQQMRALEEEDIPFALENPMGSHFWELESVKQRVERMHEKGWRLHQVDQCAYGRLSKKPTMILTNTNWTPRGLTRDGKCKIGKCSGTLGNTPGTPGAAKHAQQIVADQKERQTRIGHHPKGTKGEYSTQAARNRVETMLVQEILLAARANLNRRRATEQIADLKRKERSWQEERQSGGN